MKRILALAPVFLLACGGPPSEPVVGDLAGTYNAIRLEVTFTGESPVEFIEMGAIVSLTLNLDGTTEGRFFVPGADDDGSDIDLDLTGTWDLVEGRVHLTHAADTFLSDTPLDVEGNRLVGVFTESEGSVLIVLERA